MKQDKVTINDGKIVNIYTLYEISNNYPVTSYSAMDSCLFGALSLTKNAGIIRCKCSGCRIGFYRHGSFSFPGIGLGRNIIIFCVVMSSSVHADNKKKDVLILGIGPTQGLEHTLTAPKCIGLILHSKTKSFV